ncbi:MAG: hypothetical protein AAF705_04400 [Bacteroidota bacterium]
MKKRAPIDDLFQDRLKDFSMEAPMHLWDSIADAAAPEPVHRKRKGLLWLWLVPLLLLSGISLAYFGNNLNRDQVLELDYFPIEETSIESIKTNQQATIVSGPIAQNNPSLSKPQVRIDLDQNSIQKQSIEVQESKVSTSIDAPQTKITASEVANNSKEEERNLSLIIDKTSSEEAGTKMVENQNALLEAANVMLADDQSEAEGVSEKEDLPFWLLEPLQGPLLLVDNPIGDEVLTCPPFGAKSWLTTVDLMASMDFVMRQLEAKDPAYEDYARLRNNTETFRHGVSVGMRLSTISESGFAVRSGLNYSAINEQLNFKIKEEEKLTITTKYDTDGSVIGTDTSIQVVGTYRIVNNRYTELDIPLLIGYEYVGEKISFSFNGGAFINMLSAQKGEFVSPSSEQPVSFSSSDPNSYRAFKNRVGLGVYGSMGIYLQVKDNLQVLLEPYAKWRPGTYTVDGYFLDQRFLTTGLFVGVRKRII